MLPDCCFRGLSLLEVMRVAMGLSGIFGDGFHGRVALLNVDIGPEDPLKSFKNLTSIKHGG